MAEATTTWARAGFGLWRRERGVFLVVRTHLRGTDLGASVGALRAEVSIGSTMMLRYCESGETARVWCERWAEILLREEVT